MIANENAFLWSYLWQSTAFVTAGLVISFAFRRRPCHFCKISHLSNILLLRSRKNRYMDYFV